MDVAFFHESWILSKFIGSPAETPTTKKKTFADALQNACDGCEVSLSQLPQPCIKGDAIAVKIPKEEYQVGLQRCKNHLHGRLTLAKGENPLKFKDLKSKLDKLWNKFGKWTMISLNRGFYEFSFYSSENMRSVCATGSWNLKPDIMRLFLWTPDFNPTLHKLSHAQCWVKLVGLPQEYWSPRIIFSIAGGIGTPISLDHATSNRSFGHFAKILVDINLRADLPDKIMVEREAFAFFVSIEYENLLPLS